MFDTTLRDGEQSPGCSMNLAEKVRMAQQLESLGVDIIEAGFPIASEGDFAAVRAVASECRKVTVAALCRTSEQDVLRAAEALEHAAHPRIHTFVATSDLHLEYKLKKTRAEVIEMTRQAVALAREYAEEVEFSAEDATRSDVDYLCEVFATAVDAGATIINVPDTVGYTMPTEFSRLVSTSARASCRRPQTSRSACIVMTISDWLSPIVWRLLKPERARLNARSMVLANAPATLRSKRL